MPLNTLRLNAAPSSHPNSLIIFIKPLSRPPHLQSTYTTADTFLRAIAAQCLPLMKMHHLSITTLEEHEPNREFIGRNFNNGEIIQLVLQSKGGGWLPFEMVQMVMMHELAHNTHMNHGKGFWEVRNKYAEEMRVLWGRGYTGEGFWGSGKRLSDMQSVMGNNVVGNEELRDLPVCGGTYRSRRRKRKAKDNLTWKEKRDRRIEKKFGKNGTNLGEDEDRRMLLELGKKGPIGGKPRVAQSKRGRELRAAAALARFETNKEEVDALQKEEEIKDEEDASESGDYEDIDANLDDARDINGQRLLDSKGNTMVRVCGEEEDRDTETNNDFHIKQEMDELSGLDRYFRTVPTVDTHQDHHGNCPSSSLAAAILSKPEKPPPPRLPPADADGVDAPLHLPTATSNLALIPPAPETNSKQSASVTDKHPISPPPSSSHTPCPICSLTNSFSPSNLTCLACAHVLHMSRDKTCWPCPSGACKALGSEGYINAGDVGVCGVCGTRRPTTL